MCADATQVGTGVACNDVTKAHDCEEGNLCVIERRMAWGLQVNACQQLELRTKSCSPGCGSHHMITAGLVLPPPLLKPRDQHLTVFGEILYLRVRSSKVEPHSRKLDNSVPRFCS